MRTKVLLALVAGLAISCTNKVVPVSQGGTPTETPADETPGEREPEEGEVFGDPLDPNAPEVKLEDLLTKPLAFVGKKVTTVGTVRAVCQKRGCWMEIRPEEQREGATMRVTFFGYSFFVPKDSRGANVKVQGTLSMLKLTAEEVQHLEAEGATFPEKNADGSADQPVFTAKGVEMRGRVK
jgi:hypothetical protein